MSELLSVGIADNTHGEHIHEGKPKFKHNKHKKPTNASQVGVRKLEKRLKYIKKEMGLSE